MTEGIKNTLKKLHQVKYNLVKTLACLIYSTIYKYTNNIVLMIMLSCLRIHQLHPTEAAEYNSLHLYRGVRLFQRVYLI